MCVRPYLSYSSSFVYFFFGQAQALLVDGATERILSNYKLFTARRMTEDFSDQDEQCSQVVEENLCKLGASTTTTSVHWRVNAIWVMQASNCFSEAPVSGASYYTRAQSRPKRSKTLLKKSNGSEKVCKAFFFFFFHFVLSRDRKRKKSP